MFMKAAALLGASVASANFIPPGVPYPNSYYPGYDDPNTEAGALTNQLSPPYYPSPWQDTATAGAAWTAAYQKAVTFVSGLTLTEMVNLTTGVGWEGDRCVGNVGSIPRIGFRAMCMEDSPLGVRFTDYNSAFPAGVTIAASWDRASAYQRGKGMGQEHYAKGVDVQLGPVVGPLGRAPEGGRNWEGFSPDPVLSGILVAQTVKGIQDAGVVACTKHYIANEQEHFRQPGYTGDTSVPIAISSNIDDITMHELYLWPFADAVRAGTGSIMCSYNNVNNSYACQNSYLLNYLLKGELGFQGFVMSDWAAQHDGVASALAGLDMTMPGDENFDTGNSYWGTNLTAAVLNGSVPQWRISDMATRIMTAWYYVGRESSPEPNFSAWTLETTGPRFFLSGANVTTINSHVNVQANHAAQIRSQANRGTVLLKNTGGVLPLTGKEDFTAVIGNDAAANPAGPNGCNDRGCDIGTMAMGWGSGTANFPFLIDPLSAITTFVKNKKGPSVQGVTDNYNFGQIRSVASQAEVAVVFVNTDAGEGYITVDQNIGDRNNLTLWQGGEAVINAVTSVCRNVVVVVHSVGPVLLTSWYNNANVTAIVWANVPGEQSGNSIVDVLYGNVNPGGKLPYTLGAARADYGTDLLYQPNGGLGGAPQQNFAEGIFIDYRAFDKKGTKPIYEFGYGLSYTTFTMDSFAVSASGHSTYKPTTGMTKAAPVYGTFGAIADYLYPAGFNKLILFIYPFLSSTNLAAATGDSEYGHPESYPTGAKSGTPQPKLPASGAPGGNPGLWTVLFNIHTTVHNTGSRGGDEVVQLYVGLGGPNDPIRVLRDFDRVHIAAGGSVNVRLQLTRRDLSNWDPASQNWVISNYPKTIYVGNSSRNFYFNQTLNTAQLTGTVAGAEISETIDTTFANTADY